MHCAHTAMRRMHAQVAVSTLTLRPVSFASPGRLPREHGMIQAASMADSGQAEEMRTAMVRTLLDEGAITSERVAAAFAAVPRHLFAPGESLQAAYAPLGTIMPQRDADGLLLSVIS